MKASPNQKKQAIRRQKITSPNQNSLIPYMTGDEVLDLYFRLNVDRLFGSTSCTSPNASGGSNIYSTNTKFDKVFK
jgi:hypothetical protein